MYGPMIQGKLVRLRPPKPEDAEVMITWFEDMEVTRLLFVRNPPSIEMDGNGWTRWRATPTRSFGWSNTRACR